MARQWPRTNQIRGHRRHWREPGGRRRATRRNVAASRGPCQIGGHRVVPPPARAQLKSPGFWRQGTSRSDRSPNAGVSANPQTRTVGSPGRQAASLQRPRLKSERPYQSFGRTIEPWSSHTVQAVVAPDDAQPSYTIPPQHPGRRYAAISNSSATPNGASVLWCNSPSVTPGAISTRVSPSS